MGGVAADLCTDLKNVLHHTHTYFLSFPLFHSSFLSIFLPFSLLFSYDSMILERLRERFFLHLLLILHQFGNLSLNMGLLRRRDVVTQTLRLLVVFGL